VALPKGVTPSGKLLLKKFHKDAKRTRPKRVGMRSINDYLMDLAKTVMLIGRTQLRKSHPAAYWPRPHVVRSRSASSQLDVHEVGHALRALIEDTSPGLLEGLGDGLLALTVGEGSAASAQTKEEGFAEMVRLYVVDPESLPPSLTASFEAALHEAAPEVLDGIRDAQAAYSFQVNRSPLDQAESLRNDKAKVRPLVDSLSELMWRGLQMAIGPQVAVHRLNWLKRRAIFGDTKWQIPDPTGIFGVVQAMVDPAFKKRLDLFVSEQRKMVGTRANLAPAVQMVTRTKDEVVFILGGTKHGPEGVRVAVSALEGAPGEVDWFSDEAVEALRAGGFAVPDKPSKPGEFVYFSNKSYAKSKSTIGRQLWSLFQEWGQYRAALERHEEGGHEYPGLREGLHPEVLRKWLRQVEADHPGWEAVRQDIHDMLDSLLLVATLSGEYTVSEAVTIRNKWTDYWPLPRQVEGAPGRRHGGAPEPTAGIHRAFGSALPFKGLDEAVAVRVQMAVESWYTQELYRSLWEASQSLQEAEIPFGDRKMLARIMIPLKMDLAKAAMLSPEEQAVMLAGAMNELAAEEQGVAVEDLDQDELTQPGDIVQLFSHKAIWRAKKPNARFVIRKYAGGQYQYMQITDPVWFDMFARSPNPNKLIGAITGELARVIQPWKESVTQAWGFVGFNIPRDAVTNMGLGDGWENLIPGFNLAQGAVNRLQGKQLTAAPTELLSKTLTHTNSDAHRTRVEAFFDAIGEHVLLPDWRDRSLAENIPWRPSQISGLLHTPIRILNLLSGSRYTSQLSESLPREAAYYRAREKAGATEAEALLMYDQQSGNFGQKAGDPNFAAIVRAAGFLNPALQIGWQIGQRLSDPNPHSRAMYVAGRLPWIAATGSVAAAINMLLIHAMYDDDEVEDLKDNMRERLDDERLSYMAVGGKVSLPFDYGILGSLFSFGWNSVEEELLGKEIDTKVKAKELLERARDLPGLQDLVNPYLKAAWELRVGETGYSTYFDDEIVPSWLVENYPDNPELRHFPDTLETYKAIGRGLKVSPIKVRYAVRSYFTRLMHDLIGATEQYAGVREREALDALPIVGPAAGAMFQRYEISERRGWRSDSFQSLYELERDYSSLTSCINALKKQEGADQDQLQDLEQRRFLLADAHATMLKMEKLWGEVKKEQTRKSPDRAAIRALQRDMTKQARQFLGERLPELKREKKAKAKFRGEAIEVLRRKSLGRKSRETFAAYRERRQRAVERRRQAREVLKRHPPD